jgi:allantoinase
MSNYDLLIRGDLVLPDGVIEGGYLAVQNGTIVAIGVGEAPPGEGIVDVSGCYVFPGVIDGQTHSGSQAGREGIGAATRAAAAGGVTTIVDMPYDDPEPVITAARLRRKIDQVNSSAHVDVALYGSMAKENGCGELAGMIEAGACAFKFSSYESDPQRFARIALGDMLEAFTIVAPTRLACGVHNENQEIVDYFSSKLKRNGVKGAEIHALSRPPVAESVAIAEIFELGLASKCRAHIVHCSIDHGFDLCQYYKSLDAKVSIETCVHYLTLTEDEVIKQGAKAKINPPLRSQEEVDRLWERVVLGHVDFVSSDHVAWGLDRKSNQDFLKNASGVPGLETLFLALYTEALARGLSVTLVARLLSEGPARHFCLYPRKGVLQVGADADLTIIERKSTLFQANKSQTVADWSPYDGRSFAGRVASTYVRGEMVWNGSEIVMPGGYGRFVRPLLSGAVS